MAFERGRPATHSDADLIDIFKRLPQLPANASAFERPAEVFERNCSPRSGMQDNFKRPQVASRLEPTLSAKGAATCPRSNQPRVIHLTNFARAWKSLG